MSDADKRKELIETLKRIVTDLENGCGGFLFLYDILIPQKDRICRFENNRICINKYIKTCEQCLFDEMMYYRKKVIALQKSQEGLRETVELAIDYGLEVTEEQLQQYRELTQEREV